MTAQAIALLLAGLIAPFVTNFLKDSQWSKRQKAWLAFAVSAVLAIIAWLAAGLVNGTLAALPWGDPLALVTQLGAISAAVFAIATLVYHSFIDNQGGRG